MGILLNNKWMATEAVDGRQPLLNWLREQQSLTGTKEGCGAGDCGACTLLVGQVVAGKLEYQAVNACIAMLGSVENCHVITLEAVGSSQDLHPVQQALVDYHASQCGFCTPGIVMAMLAWWWYTPPSSLTTDQQREEHRHTFADALSGNLCRCTGYNPIFKAAQALAVSTLGGNIANVSLAGLTQQQVLGYLTTNEQTGGSRNKNYWLPQNLLHLSLAIDAAPNGKLIAGSTDLGLEVTQHLKTAEVYIDVSQIPELKMIHAVEGVLHIGSGASFSQIENYMTAWQINDQAAGKENSMARAWLQLLPLIGSRQVRNRGTLGGNIANASPIADTPPLLMALGAALLLQKDDQQRQVKLADFYQGYRQTQLQENEFIREILIPIPADDSQILVEKISKRKEDDISAACVAMLVSCRLGKTGKVDKSNKLNLCRIGLGGMAATPVHAQTLEAYVENATSNDYSLGQILTLLSEEISPLSDVRGSADYRLQSCASIIAHWLTHEVPA